MEHKCYIDEDGLTYAADTVKEIADKLYDYITEMYGKHTVLKIKTEAVYNSCKLISSSGEYLIRTKQKNIYCKID